MLKQNLYVHVLLHRLIVHLTCFDESYIMTRQVASDAAKKKELGLLDLLEETRREVAKAREGERIAGQRLEKALLNRATAIVESQAERSLREATETSRVFDSVHYDAALAQQERQEVGRVLDNAASRLRYR